MKKLKTYPQAARVVALNLREYCDHSLDYVNMIAEASRLVRIDLDKYKALKTKVKQLESVIDQAPTWTDNESM
jgi:hypothetical protein